MAEFLSGPLGWLQLQSRSGSRKMRCCMMNTDGHRVTKRPIGDVFGSNPILMMDEPFGLIWALGRGSNLDMRTPVAPVVLVEEFRGMYRISRLLCWIWQSATGSAKRQYGEKLFSFAVVVEWSRIAFGRSALARTLAARLV